MLRSQSSPREQSLFAARSPSRLSSLDFSRLRNAYPTGQRSAEKIGADLRLCAASLQLSKNPPARETRCTRQVLPVTLIRLARQAETAAHVSEWLSSFGLQPS